MDKSITPGEEGVVGSLDLDKEGKSHFTDERPLSVTMVTRRDPSARGGVERVVGMLLAEIAQARPDWRLESVSVFRDNSLIERVQGVCDAFASLRLGWKLRSSATDVIFVHCPECLWGIRLLRRRRGTRRPLVAVWHGGGPVRFILQRPPGNIFAWALGWLRAIQEIQGLRADAHVVVHSDVARDLRYMYGFRLPVTVIGNAVDPKILERLSRLESLPEKTGLTALWLGQVGYVKGLDVALAAVAEARKVLPELRLLVAGVPAGENLEGVEWCGVVSPGDVAEIYRRADLFIFPSRYESFALVVAEAMAAGLPVIVSDGVPSGLVIDGRNGMVVRGYDPDEYAAALVKLSDPATREVISKANREDIRRLSVESRAADYIALAESIARIQ